jgi:hypothetical protein
VEEGRTHYPKEEVKRGLDVIASSEYCFSSIYYNDISCDRVGADHGWSPLSTD